MYPVRLLVSVRNVPEAESALAGGCDVLDVKEPARGALGMADAEVIVSIAERARSLHPGLAVSAALGEAVDWCDDRPVPQIAGGISFWKLGTAGLGSVHGWMERFLEAKRRFEYSQRAETPRPLLQHNWVAVAYADWQFAIAPEPEDVINMASDCGLSGILIDTFSKESRCLFDWCDATSLASLAASARSQNLTFALAGRLRIDDLPALLTVQPDVIGIRSAACRAGVRDAEIDPRAVGTFREAIRRIVSPAPSCPV